MKERILSLIGSVQVIVHGTIIPLKDEHDPFCGFNYYWDVLGFIVWMKKNVPEAFELNDLEDHFETLDEFGEAYVQVIEPWRIENMFRHDDGILNIDVSIHTMIRQFTDYVINLQENELIKANEEIANTTSSFKQVMEMLVLIRKDVNHVESAVQRIPAIDSTDLAEKFVKHITSSPKSGKKLSKKEQFDVDLATKIAQEDLKLLQKVHKQQK